MNFVKIKNGTEYMIVDAFAINGRDKNNKMKKN